MRSCQDMRNPTADRRSEEETTRRATTISPLPPSFLSTTRRVYVRIGLFNDHGRHCFPPLLGCPRRGMVVVEHFRWSYIILQVLNFLTRARLSSVASIRGLDREEFVNIAFSKSHLAIFLVVEFDFFFIFNLWKDFFDSFDSRTRRVCGYQFWKIFLNVVCKGDETKVNI